MNAEALGEGLLATLQRKHPYFAKRAERVAVWLRDVAEPRDGVELKSGDGSTFTGFVIVERSAPVVMLCIRHPSAPLVDRPPVVTPPPMAYERTVYEPEDRWDRNGDPYLR